MKKNAMTLIILSVLILSAQEVKADNLPTCVKEICFRSDIREKTGNFEESYLYKKRKCLPTRIEMKDKNKEGIEFTYTKENGVLLYLSHIISVDFEIMQSFENYIENKYGKPTEKITLSNDSLESRGLNLHSYIYRQNGLVFEIYPSVECLGNNCSDQYAINYEAKDTKAISTMRAEHNACLKRTSD